VSLEDDQIDLGLSLNDERYNPERLLFEENNYQNLKEKNYTNKEISEITDNSLRTVYNIINRIKNKVSNMVSN